MAVTNWIIDKSAYTRLSAARAAPTRLWVLYTYHAADDQSRV